MKSYFVQVSETSNQGLSSKIDRIARDVIKGKYGNGQERKYKLGSLYTPVQARVNEIYKKER